MTRLGRVVRRLLEKLLDRWKEGPDPPTRLREEVRLFRHMHPNADAREWERYAVAKAETAWRDAFARGFEWNERCWPGDVDPEEVARVHDLGRSLAQGNPRMAKLLAREPQVLTVAQRKLINDLHVSPWGVRIIVRDDDA